jgi:TIR domain/SIR2-like domain
MHPDSAPNLWNDNIWDQLLEYLDEGSVIPIVGPDLLQIEVHGETVLLEQYVARCLAQNYGLAEGFRAAERPLNLVVRQLISNNHNKAQDIRAEINKIMKVTSFEPPNALLQLAEITQFNLFVSTTFDSLLETAINKVRFCNSPGVDSISYSPSHTSTKNRLPCGKNELERRTVYHLMGKHSAGGDFVISDEDVLEYMCALQSESRRPERLLDELKNNHLLILGAGFSDWLSRFFLRTAKGSKLSMDRRFLEILADNNTHNDSGLISFLLHFSSHTRVFYPGGAAEFVDELWRRWSERNLSLTSSIANLSGGEMPSNAIFISYAHEDLGAALKLAAGLVAQGLPVWLDKHMLRSGDQFNPKIKQYITRECSCFLAVISSNSEQRKEGFFRLEWGLAAEREKRIHGRRFIVPVVVDDTRKPTAVPESFEALQLTRLPNGSVTPDFAQEMRKIVSGL